MPGVSIRVSRQDEFWTWFSQHQGELLEFETDREGVFDEVAARLQSVNPDLTLNSARKDRKENL